jgi:hypothetical protein
VTALGSSSDGGTGGAICAQPESSSATPNKQKILLLNMKEEVLPDSEDSNLLPLLFANINDF